MSEDRTYNGWTNYETWLINLHIGNDQSSEYEARQLTRRSKDRADLADALKDWLEEILIPDNYDQTFAKLLTVDMINGFLCDVNWREIANHYADDYGLEDDDDDDDEDDQ